MLWIFNSPWSSEGVKGTVHYSYGKFTSGKLSFLLSIVPAVLHFWRILEKSAYEFLQFAWKVGRTQYEFP